ncbi:MAG: type II toxin-antitoxin system HicA family toxin [Candidatus Poribacteria bacterium]|nr:type II toxin-antitoxin system HicA family toxin [Candidatus Poribacteria bacterium]
MKRRVLIRHLRKHGCFLVREGRRHAIWGNLEMNTKTPVPRHTEIDNQLAADICKQLGIPTL